MAKRASFSLGFANDGERYGPRISGFGSSCPLTDVYNVKQRSQRVTEARDWFASAITELEALGVPSESLEALRETFVRALASAPDSEK